MRSTAPVPVSSAFSLRISAGLHSGWAVEGPIGSEFKIDASYVSPHVKKTFILQELARDVYDVS